jgi:hypothetical protein
MVQRDIERQPGGHGLVRPAIGGDAQQVVHPVCHVGSGFAWFGGNFRPSCERSDGLSGFPGPEE